MNNDVLAVAKECLMEMTQHNKHLSSRELLAQQPGTVGVLAALIALCERLDRITIGDGEKLPAAINVVADTRY